MNSGIFNKQISVLLIGVFILIFFSSFAQDGENKDNSWFVIQPKLHSGKPIKYSDSLISALDNRFLSAEVRFGFQSKGIYPAEYFLNFPTYGIGFYTSKLSQPDTLGYPMATYLYYQSPFIRSKVFKVYWEVDFGVAWHFNQYHPLKNPKNDLIGSDLNIIFNFNLGADIKISERFDVNADFVFTHFSNGTVKLPNKGLNQYGFAIGTKYHFTKTKLNSFKRFDPKNAQKPTAFKKKNELTATIGVGAKAVGPNHTYPVSELVLDYFRAYQWFGKFGGGLDYIYDRTLADDFNKRNMPPETKYTFVGIHASHELTVSRLSLITQLGGYLYKGIEAKGNFFFRLSLRYYLNKRFYLNMSLKTVPKLRADFIEFGGGVKIFD